MYSSRPGLIFGFHGCDAAILNRVVYQNQQLKNSKNIFDWLGHGTYFWENSPSRALEYAESLRKNPKRSNKPITKPAVLGAVIDLGFCLDLLDYHNLSDLKAGYEILKETYNNSGFKLPQNKSQQENHRIF